MLRPSPNHGTQRLPNDDDDDGLERQMSLVAIKYTLSNFQNPRWQPSDLDLGQIFNF